MTELSHEESILVQSTPAALYDLVSDVTRTGEWSPVCVHCAWEDPSEIGQAGAWFTGRNETPGRTWETRSQVVVADPGQEFSWIVSGNLVRWGFKMETDGDAARLTETWNFLPAGLEFFAEKYGEEAQARIDERVGQAHSGIPETLAAIKRIAEGDV